MTFDVRGETVVHLEKVLLERVAYHCGRRIDRRVLRAKLIDLRFLDTVTEDLALQLSAYVWGKLDPVEHHSYPATWWDAFKERWFPRWALRRWPPEYVEIHVRRGIVYPDFAPSSGPGVGYGQIEVLAPARRTP